MSEHHQHRAQLVAAGIDDAHHERALAVRPALARARRIDWHAVVRALAKYGPIALDVIEDVLGVVELKEQNRPATATTEDVAE